MHVAILYGSQTGNAEAIATRVHGSLVSRLSDGPTLTCSPCDAYESALFPESGGITFPSLIIWMTSTTGDGRGSLLSSRLPEKYLYQPLCAYPHSTPENSTLTKWPISTTGDPPDNATKLWRWFRRAKETDRARFSGLRYALLGLGDTNYDHFCGAARKLERKMNEWGAIPLIRSGFADDATGLDAIVEPWIEQLIQAVCSFVQLESTPSPLPTTPAEGVVDVDEKGEAELDQKETPLKQSKGTQSAETSLSAALSEKLKLTSSSLIPTQTNATRHLNEFVQRLPLPPLDQLIAQAPEQLTNVAKLPVSASPLTLEFLAPNFCRSIEDTRKIESQLLHDVSKFPSTRLAKVTRVRCLTGPKAVSRVIELTLTLPSPTPYYPGDSFGVVCPNPDALVLGCLECLNLDPTQTVKLSSSSNIATMSLYELLKFHYDLQFLPKKSFFRFLSEHSTDLTEKKALTLLASAQGATTLRGLMACRPSLWDILITFPHSKPPLSVLLDNLPHLQPRYYSIASWDPKGETLRFAFNVIDYPIGTKRVLGLCSTWLDALTGSCGAQLDSGPLDRVVDSVSIPIFMRPPGSFSMQSLPPPSAPLIYIGTGTGITPLLSILQYLAHYGRKERVLVLFGHRWAQDDFVYGEELTSVYPFVQLVHATSREDQSSPSFKYVQDTFDHVDLWSFASPSSSVVYVCGSRFMTPHLIALAVRAGGMTEAEAKAYWLSQSQSGHYLCEIWG